MLIGISMAFIFILSLIVTGIFRQYALASKLLDTPNSRSSHLQPTPRGGGIVFVACYLLFISWLLLVNWIQLNVFCALTCAGGLIAFVGFLDDKQGMSVKWRLGSHLLASAFALYCLGGFPSITFLGWTMQQGIVLNTFGVLYLTWLLNLFNFMDGIDGIASVEAITVCIGASTLYLIQGVNNDMLLPIGLVCVVAGFLYWNFPPAKLFMGDAGSGFLGIVLGVLSIQGAAINQAYFASWCILLACFITDATLTLIVRAYRKENLAIAHCSHAYQHAARRFSSHKIVTLSMMLINLAWLLPWAILVGVGLVPIEVGVITAYCPLLLLVLKLKKM